MSELKLQHGIKRNYRYLIANLDYVLLIIYTISLIYQIQFFSENFFLSSVRSFDDLLLTNQLQQLFLHSIDLNIFCFLKGLFNLSYGVLFWLPLYIITLPFFIADSQMGVVIAGRLFSLIGGIASWILVIKLLRSYITKNTLLIAIALIVPLFTPCVLHYQTSLHPETWSVFWGLLTIFFLMQDHASSKHFSKKFSKAITAFCCGLATKLTIMPIGGIFIAHWLIHRKEYSTNLVKKHIKLCLAILGVLHLPLAHFEIFKHYAARLYTLFVASKNRSGINSFSTSFYIKIQNFAVEYFSLKFFIILSILCIVYLMILRKKYDFNSPLMYLLSIAVFYYVMLSGWILMSNLAIFPNYAIAVPYLIPIILASLLLGWQSKVFFLFLLIMLVIEFISFSAHCKNFFSIQSDSRKIAAQNLFKKINCILQTNNYSYKKVAATPGLGISLNSTYQKLDIINVRTSDHFKNLNHVEAIIMQKDFQFHNKPYLLAINYIQDQHYIKSFCWLFQDNDITIFLKNSIALELKQKNELYKC